MWLQAGFDSQKHQMLKPAISKLLRIYQTINTTPDYEVSATDLFRATTTELIRANVDLDFLSHVLPPTVLGPLLLRRHSLFRIPLSTQSRECETYFVGVTERRFPYTNCPPQNLVPWPHGAMLRPLDLRTR